MKIVKCVVCRKPVEASDNYEVEYCCDGSNCGYLGEPLNPVFCSKCSDDLLYFSIFTRRILEERE